MQRSVSPLATHLAGLTLATVALGCVAGTGLIGPSTATAATAVAAATTAPADLAVADGGQFTTGLRLQWDWDKADTSYQVQVVPGTSFTGAATTTVTRAATAPAGGVQATTVKSLQTATWHSARVRSVRGTAASPWSAPLTAATAVAWPDPITAVTSTPGPGVGELTVRWTSTGANTTSYRVDTATTIFSRTDPSLPRDGRNARSFVVPGTQTSLTLTSAQLADAGAPLGSANHLFLRVYAVTEGDAGRNERSFANLRSAAPLEQAPAVGGSAIRVASYNVRTAGAGDVAPFDWPSRAPYAAKTILSRSPGLVALQELSPGPMDGAKSTVRQTDSLVTQLAAAGGSRYQLVRRSSYVAPGVETGSQGARILYDTSRYTLLSDCPEVTKVDVNGVLTNKGYNDSCSIELPLPTGDDESYRRRAAYAEFEDKANGRRFWFVSAHLDHRQSDVSVEGQGYETLRAQQVRAIDDAVTAMNTEGLPVIFGGDINSWQNTDYDYAPHQALVDDGYYDTAAAVSKVNFAYDTVNKFALTQAPSSCGWGARLDTIMVKGATGSNRFEIVVTPTDPRRGSDHNMVVADFALPAPPAGR